MRAHQKYFACLDADGRARAALLSSSPTSTAADGGKAIVAGNERVLRARLADARFFWDQDRKVAARRAACRRWSASLPRQARQPVLDKVRRLARARRGDRRGDRRGRGRRRGRAAELAKADLSTGMVGEFPELQGVMGRYYALHDGEAAEVADAIAEHYSPLGPNDRCPTRRSASPWRWPTRSTRWSGSSPSTRSRPARGIPIALRRAALGVIRLILRTGCGCRCDAARCQARIGHFAGRSDGERESDRRAARPSSPTACKVASARARRAPRSDRRGVRAGGEDDLVRLLRGSRRWRAFLGSRGRRQSAGRLSPRRQHPADRGDADGARYAGDPTLLLRSAEERRPLTRALEPARPGSVARARPRGFCRARWRSLAALRAAGRRIFRQGHRQFRRSRNCARTACACCRRSADTLNLVRRFLADRRVDGAR